MQFENVHTNGEFIFRQLRSRGERSTSAPYLGGIPSADRRCHGQFSGNFSVGLLGRRAAIPNVRLPPMYSRWESGMKGIKRESGKK